MTTPKFGGWKADHIRASFFADAVWDIAPEDIYSKVCGTEAEVVNRKPAANEFSASGTWRGARLEVKRTFNRVDIFLHPPPPQTIEMPLLSDVATLLPQFVSSISPWIEKESQPLNRIALGCGAFLPADDIADSYRKLHELIRVIDVNAERFRDFQFQVNLATMSKAHADLKINRLTAWSSVGVKFGTMNAGGAQQLFGAGNFAVCAIDINTDGERNSPLISEALDGLLGELGNEILSILNRGIE